MTRILFALLLLATPSFAQTSADFIDRIQRLESQNRAMNGQIEQLGFQNRELETKLKKMQDDNEFRFQELEKGKGNAGVKPATATPSAVKPPVTLGGLTEQASKGGLSSDPSAGGLKGLNSPATPEDMLKAAKLQIDAKKYELAEASLRILIEQHPKDKNIGDAIYYLGETQYQRKMYSDAIGQFAKVAANHEKASRAPSSLLRLGQSLYAVGQREQACGAYGKLVTNYPNMQASTKASMERETARAKC